jgi:hypothetical protein
VHAFNSSTQEAEAGGSPKFKPRLVYSESSRKARNTENPVSKQNKTNHPTKKKKKKKKRMYTYLPKEVICYYYY